MDHPKIPSYSIYIHPEDLKLLRGDIWCDDPVGAKLKVGKKKYDIDLVYRGDYIRKLKKKSYTLSLIKPGSSVPETDIHLNAEFMDPSLMRNKLSLDFFANIGVISPNSQHVTLKINGMNQGVYLQLESVDEQFLRKRGLPDGAIYYAINDNANFSLISPFDKDVKKSLDKGYERKYGADGDDEYLQEFIYHLNLTPHHQLEQDIARYVDIDQYLKWLAGIVCTQNFDGFIHNYSLYKNGETNLFEIIPWDYDATWGRDVHGDIMEYDYVPIEGYNTLTARILEIPSFRKRYREIIGQIIEEQFTVQYMGPEIEALYERLRPYVLLDPFKKKDIDQFDKEPEIIKQFIVDRGQYLKEHLSDLA